MPNETSLRAMDQHMQQLQAQIAIKDEQIRELNEYVANASKTVQVTINQCRKFCYSILETELTSGNISAKEMESLSLTDLLDRTVSVYRENQKNTREKYQLFAEKISEQKIMIESLKAQTSQLMVQLNSVDSNAILDPTTESDVVNFSKPPVYSLNESFGSNTSAPKQALTAMKILDDGEESIVSFSDKIATESNLSASGITNNDAFNKNYHMIDLNKFMKDINPTMWEVINVIGDKGINEQSEIKSIILQNNVSENSTINDSTINVAISNLLKMHILKRTKIVCGNRWFYIFELDEMGRRVYIEKYSRNPVISEAAKLIKEHDNLKHGYLIKEATMILEKSGQYKMVSNSRKKNRINLPNNRACIPDIVCARNKELEYFEVECGNHHQADFNDKCNKYRQVTKVINFIVPQNEVLKTIQSQIQGWIQSCGGHEALKKGEMMVKATTMKKLLENKWELVYDMSSEEPIVQN